MRIQLVAAALAVVVIGCEAKESTTTEPAVRSSLLDITAQTSLRAVRTAFNAHKGEARFLTLLSPT